MAETSATIVPLKSVSVGDYEWVDSDQDGRQDPGEPGIPGVVLTIVGPPDWFNFVAANLEGK